MHIAICDDNVADRNQLERLLKRESDKRILQTGNLFTNSFGNAEALLANPMQYDAFYIDVCKTEGITGMDVVNSLMQQGVHAPIIMCCSDINYRKQPYPDNVIFLDKPIKVNELSDSIDHALKIKSEAPSMIELREEEQTYYVTESEILYALEEGNHVIVTLSDRRTIKVTTSAINLFSQVESHSVFLAPSEKIIFNCRYIAKFGFHCVIMTDGTKFRVRKENMLYAKKICAYLNSVD